jgi:uncharacterized Zn finger protein
MEISFLVQGSSQEPYKVVFRRAEAGLSAFCNCPAGDNGQACKHRLSILNGDVKGIVSNNTQEVTTLLSWLVGTNVEMALRAVESAELQLEQAKIAVTKAKKSLGAAMRGKAE